MRSWAREVKAPVLPAVIDDVLRQGRSETADVHKQVLRGRVDIDADEVDAALHRPVERVLEFGLVHVVLILSHAYALGVYLYQFCERIHQSACNAYGSSYRDVEVRKLFSCHVGSRIDRCSVLAHYEDVDVAPETDSPHKRLCLAACRSVAYGYGLRVEAVSHPFQLFGGAVGLSERENCLVMEICSFGIYARHLAACPEARVYAHDGLLSQGCREEELSQVGAEHVYGFVLGSLAALLHKLVLYGRAYEALIGVFRSFAR